MMEKPFKGVARISDEEKAAITRKTAYSLPDEPSARGMLPDQIRKRFWEGVVGDRHSLLVEIDRVAEEVNAALDALLEIIGAGGGGIAEENDPTVPEWAKAPNKPKYNKGEIGLGNVDDVRQYSAINPPPYPVTSVNGSTGEIELSAADVGARPSSWTPDYNDVGADKKGTASSEVSGHNVNAEAHNDIRLLIVGLSERLNAIANSDDKTLDDFKELVAYIKENRTLIESITTSKVSVSDIINNLVTNVPNFPLSAAQGVALKMLIDKLEETKIGATELSSAVRSALEQAKEGGEFDGGPGPAGPAGIHIGPEAPTDGQVAWIDTDEEPDEGEGGAQIDVVAKPGQVIAVKAVDVEGKPKEYKAVDLPVHDAPDWNAAEGAAGYIEGRTHFVDANGVVHKLPNKFIDADWMATSVEHIDSSVIIPEQNVSSGIWRNRQMDIQPGITYDVHINGVVYPCVAFNEDGICIGNNPSLTRNDLPFCIFWAGGSAAAGFFYKNSDVLSGTIYMKVTGHSWTEYNTMPDEFLPKSVVKSVNGTKPDDKGNVQIEIPENTGGGSASIDVTAQVGQTIIVKEVDENGKPTKWESADYQPRTHWSEPVEVLPETTCEVIEDIGAAMLPDMEILAGDTLTVVFNGTEYICECADVDGSLAFGNYGVIDEETPVDTGEPFLAMNVRADESTKVWIAMALDGSATFTLSVVAEKVHTIPERYLPRESERYIPSIPKIEFTVDEENIGYRLANINADEITVLKKAEKLGKIKVSGDFYNRGKGLEFSGSLIMSIISFSGRFRLSGIAVPGNCTRIVTIVMEIVPLDNGQWSVVYRCVASA